MFSKSHLHRRPDLLTILVLVVFVAFGATVYVQWHTLDADHRVAGTL